MSVAVPAPVLADRLLPRSLAADTGLVVAGAALTAALAQVEVPLWPVPVTGQTLGVLLAGAVLGMRRGAASMALYAALGAIGLPVFAGAASGLGVLAGPTGGYLVGFVLAAALTGRLAERRLERTLVRGMLAFLAGSVAVFLVGLPWLQASLGLTGPQTLQAGLYPFVVGGVVKAVVAALVLRGAWAVVGAVDERRR